MWAAVPSVRPRATIESFCALIRWPTLRVTTAWQASWIAMTQRSSGVRMWVFFAGPATTRSIDSSSVAWSMRWLPSRTVSSAASLMTFASSAPENPGQSLAISRRSTSGSNGLPRPCSVRIS